jgi:hypothetical protein
MTNRGRLPRFPRLKDRMWHGSLYATVFASVRQPAMACWTNMRVCPSYLQHLLVRKQAAANAVLPSLQTVGHRTASSERARASSRFTLDIHVIIHGVEAY